MKKFSKINEDNAPRVCRVPANIVSKYGWGEEIQEGDYKGWVVEADTDTGRFDGEKGSMTDFDIRLTSPDGVQYMANDGYYNGPVGLKFYAPVVFTKITPEVTKTIDEVLKDFLNSETCGEDINGNINDGAEAFVGWLKRNNPDNLIIR